MGAYETAPLLAASTGGPYYVAAGRSVTLAGLGDSDLSGALHFCVDLNGDGTFNDASIANPVLSGADMH